MSISAESSLKYIVINPNAHVQKTIIWMHGLGADGHDFVPIVNQLNLSDSMGLRFIFPHAPVMNVTVNQGYAMPAWFDIYDFNTEAKIDEAGIAKSVAEIEKIIAREEAQGIPAERIMLAGFSQGSVIAMMTGLCFPRKLGGVLCLSGYLPLAKQVFQRGSAANRSLSFFIAHGTQDTIVPYALGKTTYLNLKQAGYPVDWHSYDMAHTVCIEEVNDIRNWIQKLT